MNRVLMLAALLALSFAGCGSSDADATHVVSASTTPLAKSIPVNLSTATPVTLLSVTVENVNPGDVLSVYADANVTNDIGVDPVTRKVTGTRYIVGVGYRLTYSGATAGQIGTPLGENCTPEVHHCVLNIGRPFKVPSDWPAGADLTVSLRADAHSTAWAKNGGEDVLRVEQYGAVIVDHFSGAQRVC